MENQIIESLARLRAEGPLVHHITNAVTIAACADLAKALGASPLMAHAREEAADMARLADALVLNIGTPDPQQLEAMLLAGQAAMAKGIPIVLDLCGNGASQFRNSIIQRLCKDLRLSVVKGNASELACLAGLDGRTRGVDSAALDFDPLPLCAALARELSAVAVMTGAVDTIAAPDGRVYRVENGHALMGKVVGTGCLATTAIACFAAVSADAAFAAAAALVCYEISGELAAARCRGPASFRAELLDALAGLEAAAIRERMALHLAVDAPLLSPR